MKIAIGLFLVIGGALGTLIVTPYAFIAGIMSGFSDDPNTLAYCIAAPLATVGSFVAGILLLQSTNKNTDDEKR